MKHTPSSRLGLGLTEVLVGTLILGVLSLAFHQTLVGNIDQTRDLELRLKALMLAQQCHEMSLHEAGLVRQDTQVSKIAAPEPLRAEVRVEPWTGNRAARLVSATVSWSAGPRGPVHQVRVSRVVRDLRASVPPR